MVSFLIATALMLLLSFPRANPRRIGTYLLTAVLIAIVAEGVFGIYSSVLHLLGKNPTLTDRTYLWHNVLQMKINPILGAGYESFWLGDHIKPENWARVGFSFVPNEAHNCYLETYLNLGLAGLALLIGWFIETFQKARRDLVDGVYWGRFRLGYLIAVLFYNWTEAPFKAVDPVYFVYFLIAMDYPKAQLSPAIERASEPMAGLSFAAPKVWNSLANGKE
jgi:O-antigen ligase